MAIFRESRLTFSFDDIYWDVIIRVDGHVDYRKAQVLPQFKIADFACGRVNEIIIVEAKNYVGYSPPSNHEKLLNGIASKVKDTISCIVASNLNSITDQARWNFLVQQLINRAVIIKVVFWCEDTYPNLLRAKAGASAYENILKRKLRWLTTNVIVANTHIGGVNGLTVT